MIYGDTSFLFAIYNSSDKFHAEANRIAQNLRSPFAYTLLHELEVINGLGRGLATKTINRAEHDSILRQLKNDEVDGLLVRYAISEVELYHQARILSGKYTPLIAARSLDILHVASALLLKATAFISFDAKQRLLVQKVSVPLLPRSLSKQ